MNTEPDLFENYLTTSVLSLGPGKDKYEWYLKYFDYHLLPHFPKAKDSRILELGCGCGMNISALMRNGYENVSGVDISSEQINCAKSKLGVESVIVADAFKYLESNTEKYDVVLLIDILEHFDAEATVSFLKLVRSVLAKNGRVIIQTPCAFSAFMPNYFRDITHKRAYTPQSMTQTLLMSGYKQFRHYPLGTIPNGIKNGIRWALWNLLIVPAIYTFMLVAYGEDMGGIYTANMLTIVDA